MLPTFVNRLPDGSESGDFLILDFGGHFFRVAYVNIKKSEKVLDSEIEERKNRRRFSIRPFNESKLVDLVAKTGKHVDDREDRVFMESAVYPLRQKNLESAASDLFDHLGKLTSSFLKRFNLEEKKLSVVYVHSSPVRQESLSKAVWHRWTKGVRAEGMEGQELTEIIQSSLDKHKLTNLSVDFIVNDSTACLFTGLSEHPSTRIGIIIGSGFNISFVHTDNDDDVFENQKFEIINSEIGSFGENGELDKVLTQYDRILQQSDFIYNKDEQTFEKMLTGRCLPELFRIITKSLTEENLLFQGMVAESLETSNKFPPNFFSQLVKAADEGLNQVQDVLFEADVAAMYADADAVVQIVKSLTMRAAALISAALAGVIKATSHNKTSVAVSVDGSTWKSYPKLADFIKQMTQDLVGYDTEVIFRTNFDGSAKGAAFLAAANK